MNWNWYPPFGFFPRFVIPFDSINFNARFKWCKDIKLNAQTNDVRYINFMLGEKIVFKANDVEHYFYWLSEGGLAKYWA